MLLVRTAQGTYNLPIRTITRKAKFTQNLCRQYPYSICVYAAATFCAVWLVLFLPKIGIEKTCFALESSRDTADTAGLRVILSLGDFV